MVPGAPCAACIARPPWFGRPVAVALPAAAGAMRGAADVVVAGVGAFAAGGGGGGGGSGAVGGGAVVDGGGTPPSTMPCSDRAVINSRFTCRRSRRDTADKGLPAA